MQARFIGDPVERSKGRFTNPPSDEWIEVPAGEEQKYRNHSHYEVRESVPLASPRRSAKRAEPKAETRPEAPPIQHDGWEEGEE